MTLTNNESFLLLAGSVGWKHIQNVKPNNAPKLRLDTSFKDTSSENADKIQRNDSLEFLDRYNPIGRIEKVKLGASIFPIASSKSSSDRRGKKFESPLLCLTSNMHDINGKFCRMSFWEWYQLRFDES
ncbi:hypothetical protein Ciccas_001990 [Cichlidogyrus casuarinus]|uniref:Uncharacterized protein n=1 Tax=Cichlidogyrus casuarinus TaxID=1844966 RepID=A0ABD2QKS2_9PLAT